MKDKMKEEKRGIKMQELRMMYWRLSYEYLEIKKVKIGHDETGFGIYMGYFNDLGWSKLQLHEHQCSNWLDDSYIRIWTQTKRETYE